MSVSYFDPEFFCSSCDWVGEWEETIQENKILRIGISKINKCPQCFTEVREINSKDNKRHMEDM